MEIRVVLAQDRMQTTLLSSQFCCDLHRCIHSVLAVKCDGLLVDA